MSLPVEGGEESGGPQSRAESAAMRDIVAHVVELAVCAADGGDEAFTEWLLRVIRSGDFGANSMVRTSDVTPVISLALRSKDFPEDRFKRALSCAVREWLPSPASIGDLNRLCSLVATVGATGVSRPLAAHIAHLSRKNEPWVAEALDYPVAVLCGLAPNIPTEDALVELYDDRPGELWGGSIFVGLARCDVSHFSHYLPRLLRLSEQFPSRFSLPDILFNAIESGIGPTRFYEVLPTLPSPIGVVLLRELKQYPSARVTWRCLPSDHGNIFGGEYDGRLFRREVGLRHLDNALHLASVQATQIEGLLSLSDPDADAISRLEAA